MLPSLPLQVKEEELSNAGTNEHMIKAGDMVIAYENHNSMKAVVVDANGRFDNRFGAFPHKEWIGKPFGSKVFSKSGSQGWIYLLRPTVDLWTHVLRHRTQILYVADISMAVSHLDLVPGSVVLESGTGSGSLTHSLIRAVAPTGHVHTFEFHPERASEAAKEFKAHGLSQCVTVRQRNIEELGFPRGGPQEEPDMIDLNGKADAVFLDLPAPHKVVPSAATCLRPDGRFCSFSPCIEQVQKTCEALECNGFTDIQTLECLLRVHEVRTERVACVRSGPPQQQTANVGEKRPRDENTADAEQQGTGNQQQGEQQSGGMDTDSKQQQQGTTTPGDVQGAGSKGGSKDKSGLVSAADKWVSELTYRSIVTSKPEIDARGHTGYLTFARKFVTADVLDVPQQQDEEEKEGDNGDGEDAVAVARGDAGEDAAQE